MNDEQGQAEKKKYRGEAEATASEIKEEGGEKTLPIDNYLFQSDADAQAAADALLARLKTKKEYFEAQIEFCAVPVERGDLVAVEERLTPTKSIWHRGIVRQIKLSVTPTEQKLTLVLEE